MFYMIIEYSRLPEMYPIFAPLQLGKLALIAALVGFLLNSKVRAAGSPASKGIDFAMLIFVVGNFFSACLAREQAIVWSGLLDVVLWGLVYFLMSRTMTSKYQLRIFLGVLFLLNLKLAQHTVRDYMSLRSSGMGDMDIIMRGGAGQGASSFFGNVADLGLAMCVVWGISWALLIGRAEKKKFAQLYLLGCFAGFFLAILFCGSRGAVVGAGAITLVALIRAKKFGAVLLAIVFVLAVWLVLPSASKQRFQNAWNGTDANANTRLMFWRAGLVMFADNPIFGVGPNNFPVVNPTHYVSHSLYIQCLAESGAIGSICAIAMVAIFFSVNSKTRKRALEVRAGGKRSFEYCLAFGLDLGMVGYLSSGAFLAVFYYPHLWILLGLSVALNKSLDDREEGIAPSSPAVPAPLRRFAWAAPQR